MVKNDLKFTKEQNEVWSLLFKNQIENARSFACKEYLEGFHRLNLPSNRIPSLEELNNKIFPISGWKVIRTNIRYSDALPWYQHLSKKEFIVTNYLRSKNEMDFSPEPDMFHDIFGHLPFLTSLKYVEIFDMFSDAYLKATESERLKIGRLAWFSYEFGLVKEKDSLKIFGAGVLSSRGETMKVTSGETSIKPFSIKSVLSKGKAVANFNKTLFVFESLDELKFELNKFLIPIRKRDRKITVEKIKDKEMDLTVY